MAFAVRERKHTKTLYQDSQCLSSVSLKYKSTPLLLYQPAWYFHVTTTTNLHISSSVLYKQMSIHLKNEHVNFGLYLMWQFQYTPK